MRGLIRLDLKPVASFNDLWSNRQHYDDAIIALFREIGYVPKDPRPRDTADDAAPFASDWNERQRQLLESAEIAAIFEDVPPDIISEEQRHMIMLGYTSEGQSTFVVCAINPTELHIRTRQGLFERLRRSCLEITRKVRRHRSLLARIFVPRKLSAETRYIIEVMEAHRDIPTIRGEIIHSAWRELFRQNWPELTLAAITGIVSVFLFIMTPRIAAPTQAWLSGHGFTFNPAYIGGAFERIYSAFLVTFFITVLTVIIRWLVIWRSKPIKWNSEIEPRTDAGR